MNLVPENASRKIDSLGRVSFPKGLRDRFEIMQGEEMEFYLGYVGEDEYIVLRRVENSIDPKYKEAFNVLTELGCEIPQALKDKVMISD